jgi:hypothetical protein
VSVVRKNVLGIAKSAEMVEAGFGEEKEVVVAGCLNAGSELEMRDLDV